MRLKTPIKSPGVGISVTVPTSGLTPVNSLVEFRIIGDAWAFDKLQTRNFSELIYFLVMKVDKTKLGKDVHENNDNTYIQKRTWSCIRCYREQNRSI